MPRARDALTWLPSEAAPSVWFDQIDRFTVGDVEFRCSFEEGSEPHRFFICKNRPLLEQYLDAFDSFPAANMVELGIAQGGSAALTALVAPPRKLVALDLIDNRVEALDDLIERLGLAERIRPYYGVDQADRARLQEILDDEFGDEPLDLVIDDASHRLEETRASFETLFPRLRPGGLFLIEDWNQQRLSGALGEALETAAPDSPIRAQFENRLAQLGAESGGSGEPLPADPFVVRLVMELMLAQAESDQFLSELTVGHYMIAVRRGPGELDPETFRLSDLYTNHLGLLPNSTPTKHF